MPNMRDSSATIMNHPVRQLQDMSAAMSTAWPTGQLTNLTSIATHSLAATCALWSDLFENQKRFTVRLLDAMRASAKAQAQPPQLSNPSLVGSIVDDRDSEREQRPDSQTEDLAPPITETSRRRADSNATPSESEFPIKRYDTLTVQEIASKIDRLRDHRSLRTVLAYEAKNKARKGVAAAGQARLKRLSDS